MSSSPRAPRAVRVSLLTALACGALLTAVLPFGQSVQATTPAACTVMTQPLGAATGYTEFIEGNGHRGSESEGAIAWGGNLDASGMTVGTRLTSGAGAATLVVRGTHGQYFNLQRGSAYLNPASGVNFNGGGSYLASNPIDFAAAFAHLRATSTTWGTAASTGSAALGVAGGNTVLVLTGTDPTLNVFNLTQAQLASGSGIGYDVPAGSNVLVNVTGTAVTLTGQVWVKQGGGYQQANDSVMESWPGIIWNFPSATTVTMNVGSAWGGSILAPNAFLDVTSVGHTIGQLIAASFSSNYETHQRLFPSTACLPTAPPPPAERSDVTVTKTAANVAPHGGEPVTYTLLAQNVGLDTATGVVVRDQLPAGVELDSASAPCTQSGGVVTCNIGDLAPGASRSLWVEVTAIPLAGAGAPADPQAYHELTLYKVEVQVDLDPGQTKTVPVACQGSDILTDGSVRVDHVDQGAGTLTDVHVLSAESTGIGSWKAVVGNDATGRAQAKAFVVCLPTWTEVADRHTGHADGHRHALSADSALVSSTQAWDAGRQTKTLACPIGTMAIAPGFSLSGGAATLAGSEPVAGGWKLTLDVTAPTTATLTVRCLRTTVGAEQGHTHDLVTTHVVRTVTVSPGAEVEEQVICPDDAKGVLATWTLPPGVFSIGNDPRLKARAFRLLNTTNASQSVTLDLECLRDRTGLEVMGTSSPVVVDNTATVVSGSTDADPGNNSSTATITVQPGSATAALGSRARLVSSAVSLRVASSMPGRGALTVRAGGRVLARGTVALRPGSARTVRLPLTAAGRRTLLGSPG
ncbi:MAG: conserved repeat domain, partial [Nocardioides sp.]|nr:conserved repeat domain [Nocardioides sp.]